MEFGETASLCENEKKIVKSLLLEGWRNQDIQALVNTNRKLTINFARIADVKANKSIEPAPTELVDFYKKYRASFDPRTGLNHYRDEKLIRSREAMILAVHAFNSPTLLFKAEVFSMLANVAWTYLLHVYYEQNGVKSVNKSGFGLLLSEMISKPDCPLSETIIANLRALKEIRDAVEHTFFAKSDFKYFTIFQACCLNYDKTIIRLFDEKLSLQNELSLSLQFGKMEFDQLVTASKYEIPKSIKTLDAKLKDEFGEYEDQIEYQFAVNFELVSATKASSHINFTNNPKDLEGTPHNVLVKKVVSDESWPYKAGVAAKLISKLSGLKFSVNNHTSAWKYFDARPNSKAKQPQNTNKKYCTYHPAHKDYTYSDEWIKMVAEFIKTEENFIALKKK